MTSLWLIVAVVGCSISPAFSQNTSVAFTSCGGTNTVTSLYINPGPPTPTTPCQICSPGTLDISAMFTAGGSSTSVIPYIFVQLGSSQSKIPVQFAKSDGCANDDIQPSCPLQTGKSYSYRFQINLSRYPPRPEVTVYFTARNENDDVIACIYISGSIVQC